MLSSIVLHAAVMIALAAVAVCVGILRRIQGGWGGKIIPHSLIVVSYVILAGVPMALGLSIMEVMIPLHHALLATISIVVVALSHLGPKHGEAMDMGRSGGTVISDFLLMTCRFTIPLIVMAGILHVIGGPWWGWFVPVAGIAPSLTYLLAWQYAARTAPTEVAELVYPMIYHTTFGWLVYLALVFSTQ